MVTTDIFVILIQQMTTVKFVVIIHILVYGSKIYEFIELRIIFALCLSSLYMLKKV